MDKVKTFTKLITDTQQSITEAEVHLSPEDFMDYCDTMYTMITYWQEIIKKLETDESTSNKS